MWSRGELKSNARELLMPYYWMGVLVCILSGILGGGSGFDGIRFSINRKSKSVLSGGYSGSFSDALEQNAVAIGWILVVLVGMTLLFAFLIVFSVFVGNIIWVGKLKFFLESRYRGISAGAGLLFFGFGTSHYLNIVKIMFLKGLYEFLWGLLLVIPGIYKHYEYYMIPYLLAENPGIDSKEAFRLSKEMMDGNRFNTWVLELSFMGWYLLGALACGIGMLLVNPYYEATLTELYLHLRGPGTKTSDFTGGDRFEERINDVMKPELKARFAHT